MRTACNANWPRGLRASWWASSPRGARPARQGVEIQCSNGNTIGQITSGGFGPTVGGPVAMGYVSKGHGEPGESVNLIIRGKPQPAEIVALPFVTQNYKR